MVPPLEPVRIRSIERWLRDYSGEALESSNISARAKRLDERMIEEFDRRSDDLLFSLMHRGDWGRETATSIYRSGEMSIWREIVQEFLPVPDAG